MRWIYRAMMGLFPGLGQEHIDGTELWVIADALEAADKAQKARKEAEGGESPAEFFAESEDLGRQRAEFLAGKGPAPVAPSPRVPIPAGMMEALQRRRAEKAAADGGDTGRGRA